MKIFGVQPNKQKTIDRTGRGFLFGFFKCGRERVGIDRNEKAPSEMEEADGKESYLIGKGWRKNEIGEWISPEFKVQDFLGQ